MKTNKRLLLGVCAGLLVGAAALTTASALSPEHPHSDLLLANAEALSQSEGRPPEWWDFFNNYEFEMRIPINTSEMTSGTITIEGVEITLSNSSTYTHVVIHKCYDGGNRDECTSSHVAYYI